MAKKAKPAKNGVALVTFLLDRTGSMASIKDATIEAFNAYLGSLKADTDSKIDFTFLQFDSVGIDKVCIAEPVAKVAALTHASYLPRATTPLIDAAVKTIKATETALEKRSDRPKVIVCIQTDGQENASTEHTWDELNRLITEKSAAGWQFNFMGAGIDAYAQASKMGIATAQTVSYDSNDLHATRAAFAASAENARGYSSGVMASTGYTSAQKFAAKDHFQPGRAAPPSLSSAKPTQHATPLKRKSLVDDFTL